MAAELQEIIPPLERYVENTRKTLFSKSLVIKQDWEKHKEKLRDILQLEESVMKKYDEAAEKQNQYENSPDFNLDRGKEVDIIFGGQNFSVDQFNEILFDLQNRVITEVSFNFF